MQRVRCTTSRAGGLVGDPGALEHPGREQLREGARVVAVGLLLGVADRRKAPGVDDHHLAHVRADDPRDQQCVPRRLQGDAVLGPELPGELLKRLGPSGHARCAADGAVLPDRDFAEVAMDVESDTASHGLLPSLMMAGSEPAVGRDGHTTVTEFVLKAHPGKSLGRPWKLSSSKLIP